MIVDGIVPVEYITQFIDGILGGDSGGVNSRYICQITKREKLDSPMFIIKPEGIGEL